MVWDWHSHTTHPHTHQSTHHSKCHRSSSTARRSAASCARRAAASAPRRARSTASSQRALVVALCSSMASKAFTACEKRARAKKRAAEDEEVRDVSETFEAFFGQSPQDKRMKNTTTTPNRCWAALLKRGSSSKRPRTWWLVLVKGRCLVPCRSGWGRTTLAGWGHKPCLVLVDGEMDLISSNASF